MQRTGIDWLETEDGTRGWSWNPLKMRCDRVSSGCDNCWAMRFMARYAANPTLKAAARRAYAGGAPWMDEVELRKPLQIKKLTFVAVQLTGDFFHESVPLRWRQDIYDIMRSAKHLTFVLLTKRAAEMRRFLSACGPGGPLINLWPGISAEDQETLEPRLECLLATPAARRVVSVEPLLGPVDVETAVYKAGRLPESEGWGIDWVIAGGETGPCSRPVHPDWARSLRDQCQAAGVPFWFKQWGEFAPMTRWNEICEQEERKSYDWPKGALELVQRTPCTTTHETQAVIRVGAKRAGRSLDGREWRQRPPAWYV